MSSPVEPSVWPPAVAGTFYPRSADHLRAEVDRLLGRATASSGPAPKAIIAPHAGYIYSGPIAAAAYARLGPIRDTVERVVLLGPAHRLPFRGCAVPSAHAFRTPLGDVVVDRDAVERLVARGLAQTLDAAFAGEHCLEVHLPFLQRALDAVRLVPIVVGDAAGRDVAAILEHLWGGAETLIVVSSDLSHYYDYAAARERDAATARAIERLDGAALDDESACGRIPIRGMLEVAAQRGLRCARLDLRNSGDTAGPRTQVVGYGAWVLS